jgi:hypothetical protein
MLFFCFTLAVCIVAFGAGISLNAQVTYSDSFYTNVNYLTNGISGTIWDGVWNARYGGAFGGPGNCFQPAVCGRRRDKNIFHYEAIRLNFSRVVE